ncbi:putative serine/threonine-protein kinase-like protein-like [Capsicum annuum]|nr:putative serine/threonine-protein kinase-like protein-like [Capsicum annuum]
MESQITHHLYERRPIYKSKAPATKWFKEWVPQDVVATGGKCSLLKWVNEATLKGLKEKPKEPGVPVPEPEPTTEVLFLCSYEGCGKTFIDAGALRKHSHIHGERQYVCHYEGCGKDKFGPINSHRVAELDAGNRVCAAVVTAGTRVRAARLSRTLTGIRLGD